MTKKFDVIPVEDYAVVVDKEAPIEAMKTPVWNELASMFGKHKKLEDFYCAVSISREKPLVNGINVFAGIHKVIATIGKRIEGLPLIELPKYNIQVEALNYLIEVNKEIEEAGAKHLVSTNDYDQGFIDGSSFGYKAAQSKGVYSEEDMITFAKDFHERYSKEHVGTPEAMIDEYKKNKLPVAVELEMEEYRKLKAIELIKQKK